MALKLIPEICAKVPIEEKPSISKSTQPEIDALVKLMKDTKMQFPKGEIDPVKFGDQLAKFNNAIKLPSGKKIQSYFVDDNKPNNSKTEILKAQAKPLKPTLQKNKKTSSFIKKPFKKGGCTIS